MNSRGHLPYDIVVWGATGFTGQLVVQHLLECYGLNQELSWAIAGRDQAKLEGVRDALGWGARSLPILLGDATDWVSLCNIARQTRVVCSTVGPYYLHGSPLVEACAQEGADYCDLAGEPHWIRQMIDEHHSRARTSGARIVNSCGFDSIPSDLGVHFLHQHALAKFGSPAVEIRLRVLDMKGGFSGGTVASILVMLEAVRADSAVASVLTDPYCLNPSGERSGPDGADRMAPAYDAELKSWIGPFIMAGINTRVVRRSNALLSWPYGKQFRYEEATVFGPGVPGRLKATAAAAGAGAFVALGSMRPGRALLNSILPQSGEGPGEVRRHRGSFRLQLLGKMADGQRIRAEVTGDRDPGYGATSRMLGESAVHLAKTHDTKAEGGLLTPASVMGDALIPRLTERAGLTFRILEEKSDN